MKKLLCATALSFCLATSAQAALNLSIIPDGIDVNGTIEPDFGYCVADEKNHTKPGPDKSIGLTWSGAPKETKSFALIMTDPDVPTSFNDANKEDKTIPDALARQNFYHWVLINIPATTYTLPAGQDSDGVTPNGKSDRQMPYGLRGINGYAFFLASDPVHSGVYAGYDGPCPPWNDERLHHYHLHLYALDIDKLTLSVNFGGDEVLAAIKGHVLAEGEITGTYTLNKNLAASTR